MAVCPLPMHDMIVSLSADVTDSSFQLKEGPLYCYNADVITINGCCISHSMYSMLVVFVSIFTLWTIDHSQGFDLYDIIYVGHKDCINAMNRLDII